MSAHTGRVIWREAMTRDLEKAKGFYGELFNWSYEEMKMPTGVYTIVKAGTKSIGGMMQSSDEHMPSFWAGYVCVKNVDAALDAVKSGGGKVLWGPIDAEGVGRFAGFFDTEGACIAVLAPSQPDREDANARPAPGEFCWETLTTNDVAKAQAFYTSVMGWQASKGVGMDTFAVGEGMENQVADIQKAQGPVPPNWLSFVVVEKIEASLERAARLGGKTMMPAMAVPSIGRIAVIVDNQGAAIGLFEPQFS